MNRRRKISLGLIVLVIAIVIGSQSWISMQFSALSLDPKVVQGIGKSIRSFSSWVSLHLSEKREMQVCFSISIFLLIW